MAQQLLKPATAIDSEKMDRTLISSEKSSRCTSIVSGVSGLVTVSEASNYRTRSVDDGSVTTTVVNSCKGVRFTAKELTFKHPSDESVVVTDGNFTVEEASGSVCVVQDSGAVHTGQPTGSQEVATLSPARLQMVNHVSGTSKTTEQESIPTGTDDD
ncbi:hypothetical protein LTS08_008820 [Lithohypha guttulata]|nr:hypothetical protein LTS08_008820 [Lithohypha guttulata]